MSTFLCKNGVRKEYFLTPTFIIEPFFTPLFIMLVGVQAIMVAIGFVIGY